MSGLGMFPVFVLKKTVSFPGDVFYRTLDLEGHTPKGKTVMETWGHYFSRGSMLLCAVATDDPGHGVCTVRSQRFADIHFFEDAVFSEVVSVEEAKQGSILLELKAQKKFKIVQAIFEPSTSEVPGLPLPLATHIFELDYPKENDSIPAEYLYRLSVALRDFLREHKDQLDPENSKEVYALPAYIDGFLKKNRKQDPVKDARLFSTIRTAIYQLGSRVLHRVVDVQDLHLMLAVSGIKDEVGVLCDLLEDADMNRADAPKTQRQRFEAVRNFMHADLAKEVERNIDRLEVDTNTTRSSEMQTAQNYVDFVLSLPWGVYTKDNDDLANAETILNKDHTGIDKVKERIIEILAVRKQNPRAKGPILAFVGPPGVGKTSLGRAIASALGRNFRRISLGGVRDEAEIRGHRRTYIGSLPGQILLAIQRSGSMNPVIVLDEVDKIREDTKGDPSAALMEVLDTEQNHEFKDHYLDTSFDLSSVLFICTANVWGSIPHALRDRMEKIYISGYTEREKINIARNQLIPKQIIAKGMEKSPAVQISDDVLVSLIGDYTLESGLRELDRELGLVFQKIVKKRLKDGQMLDEVLVTQELLQQLLGRPRNEYRKRYETLPGEAVGMAYMSSGVGEITPVQCTIVPGRHRKEFSQPGNMGRTMRNANKQGLSQVKVYLERCGRKDLLKKFDRNLVQVTFPDDDGGIDGPSAGVAVFLAILSKLYEKPLKQGIAMTGKIDALGRVLAIGGVKEKLLAAERAGIHEIMMPKKNERHLEDLDPEDRNKMKIHLIETLDEAIRIAFEGTLS